ncbi:hypothetical protein BK816_04465 [Boudabousia tangfeifanii]|uniref:DUF881 domain-containing protein n=1 Tax=Boudabousia tangfeifanii TaxID=1912795 RepID=A0A1D9MK28_9ACTO|nr:DUF881 domain-containing protein [Boudabousia tangfeifanii]AOZ72642.1 hypothetical protein BK816_04465 [Boudabousia tangfeifanii]
MRNFLTWQSSGKPRRTASQIKDSQHLAEQDLLGKIFSDPLEHGYEAMAAVPKENQKPLNIAQKLAVIVLTALLVAASIWSIRDLNFQTSSFSDPLAPLRSQVENRQNEVEKQLLQNEKLQAEIAKLSEKEFPQASVKSEELLAAAAAPVSGPGIVLTLTDPKGIGGQAEENLVQDRDLQEIINALWANGAQAISLNGFRIGPQSAVRAAGSSVLVNLQSVKSPYALTVIGDPTKLRNALREGPMAYYLKVLADKYSIGSNISVRDELVMPAMPYHPLASKTLPEENTDEQK